ncbi:hypothetical protein [Microbacterium candidum]|uniref:Uncharacterized protein n=1 Tax=Microbacterium candidum TaxID=3041922 RepID=A0ABT7MWL1_9MICO|nr:hypothetical protein [Microbacterium sp. ASV49]MDL9978837.1 hypothetical protein [Microbacterium sp. ASV49]
MTKTIPTAEECEAVRADLLDLADAGKTIAKDAAARHLMRTHKTAHDMAAKCSAAASRIRRTHSSLANAEDFMAVAVDVLADAAHALGESNHGHH